jgi:hypothetical protein
MNKIIENVTILMTAVFLSLSISHASDQSSISKVSVFRDSATIVINGTLEISSIVKTTSGSVTSWQFPKGVEVSDINLKNRITASLNSSVIDKEIVTRVSYAVASAESLTTTGTKKRAKAKIIFNGSILIDCNIMNTKKGLWILWPHNFKVINSSFRKTIEKSIYKKSDKTSK